MINGLDIYYSNVGKGLKPISNKQIASRLKPVSNKKTASGLNPVSKRVSCKKYGRGLKILQ